MDAQQQDMLAQFCAVTGASPASGQTALNSANWNLEEAVSLYYAAQEGEPMDEDDDVEEAAVPVPAQPTPAQPQPAAASSSSSRKPPSQKPKRMTLDELKKREENGDESDEDGDKRQNMFAGGEKSGLAVQNPNKGSGGGGSDHFNNIMNQARQNRDRPDADDGEAPRAGSSNFAGRAQTLGGEDAPSQIVEDPFASARQAQQRLPRVTRTLHLWDDGISVDDGPLFRFDDPANQSIMQEINQGRAPVALLDVAPGQEVDLNLDPHKGEKYVAPKKVYKPFSGSGQRLGSPTPGPGPSAPPPTTTSTAAASSSPAQAPEAVEVDESQPTVQLRVQLAEGTRLTTRFNTSHTIGDVYSFVDAARPENRQRAYALMTTFPSRELEDRSVALGNVSEFKRGGVVVQKWK